MRGFEDNDKVGIVFTNTEFPDKPLAISLKNRSQMTSAVILDTLGLVLQSNSSFFTNNQLTMALDRVQLPTGRGRVSLKGATYEEFCRRKYGIVTVNNDDNYCLAYAIALGIAHRSDITDFKKLKANPDLLKQRGRELSRACNVNLSNGGNLEDIKCFQDYLKNDFTLVVYNNRRGSETYFKGEPKDTRKTINLILEDNHYNLILSLTAAFSTSYFCEPCQKRYGSREKHVKCPYACPNCHSSPPCGSDIEEITCKDCKRTFRGIACLNMHKEKLCSKLHRCLSCLNSYWTKDKHNCGYCRTCLCLKPIRHDCYMQPSVISDKTKKSLENDFLFAFYDFECMQEKEISSNIFLHEPNLCVVEQVCSECITSDNIDLDCIKCGKRKHIFSKNPVESLLNFLHEFEKKKFNVFALAHNMKGYDGCFITKHIFKHVNRWNPQIIRNRCKFVSITCNNIKFIDSLNYMPLPLNKLPSAFKFEEVKGYFPHLFNRTENSNYVGPLPDASFYMPDSMTLDARSKFFKWYNENISNNVVFNFKEEIIKYCIMDVDILRKSCIKFRECFIEATNIDPFQEATTIASVCNKVFRRNFLQPNTIGVIPPKGYRMKDNFSEISLKWLCWQESLFPNIKHAGNSHEIRLKENLLVDGFCATTNTVFEFDGCFFHGCEKCFPQQTTSFRNSTNKNQQMFLKLEKTKAKHNKIKEAGYNFKTIWECEFRELLKTDKGVRDYVNNNYKKYIESPLNPRESFFGGRTNAVKLYHKISDINNEKIHYCDACSLYPFVNKYKKYPIGRPQTHVGDEACRKLPMDTVEGIIKCSVLPPRNLYHPVLPYKCNNKLMFPLCKACVESLYQGKCLHTEEERKFTGTFVADELRKAISLNYKILEIYEVWEYKVTQFDRKTKSGGLFSKYVDTFLKIKQECSGWPSWCTTEESKDAYIQAYFEHEGILLDKTKICHNPGMRFIAKLMLNSFWGKFGQRENLMQTTVISTPQELFDMLTDSSIIVNNMVIISDEMLLISWKKHEEAVSPLSTVNVAIAAYTTAMARLELYSYLEKLGKRVLYFDTDSVIFTHKEGEWMPDVGDYLGMLTDEVAEYGPGSKITEFVSGGPKNYAYKIYIAGKQEFNTVCKVKGITINSKSCKNVNFETLKAMVCDNAEATYVHNTRKICITSNYDIISRPESKIYRIGYTKRRRIDSNYDTVPYGYLEEEEACGYNSVNDEQQEMDLQSKVATATTTVQDENKDIPFYMDGWTL
ncbi:unnamed protein product [Brassicogethes aeneus]|uniref:DNA-directed DNA polymerase n=1 Tax=Brassicogethes aeneus TaxID=1431903 RepID=A0A9P0BCM5_BRAAE|nr:unnamed protein product [Brassicogethes aeneus]